MATHRTKSGAAGRHKAARPTPSRIAGKRGPEPKRVDERDASSTTEASERSSTRGSRWEHADDETMITRPDQPDRTDAPLADRDDAPEESER
jgi:hypothetical protein